MEIEEQRKIIKDLQLQKERIGEEMNKKGGRQEENNSCVGLRFVACAIVHCATRHMRA